MLSQSIQSYSQIFVAGHEFYFFARCEFFQDNFLIVDSFPLEVCKFGRANFCKCFSATYSYNPSTFFGYKVHVLTTERGAIKLFEIISANVDDRFGLEVFSYSISTCNSIITTFRKCSAMLSNHKEKKLLALQLNNSYQNFPTETR